MSEDNVVELDSKRPHRLFKCLCRECASAWMAAAPTDANAFMFLCPHCGETSSFCISDFQCSDEARDL